MKSKNLKVGDQVIVMDRGLMQLYALAKRLDPDTKPNNQGYVHEIQEDGTIIVEFPIGDEDINEHSQVAPYFAEVVIKRTWKTS
ncbi:MAG: hypothetical protein AAF378_10595 [Cyanobacteria bacterium P01_A01_bin.84]